MFPIIINPQNVENAIIRTWGSTSYPHREADLIIELRENIPGFKNSPEELSTSLLGCLHRSDFPPQDEEIRGKLTLFINSLNIPREFREAAEAALKTQNVEMTVELADEILVRIARDLENCK